MIEFIKAFKASDGTICGSLEEVKDRELGILLAPDVERKVEDIEDGEEIPVKLEQARQTNFTNALIAAILENSEKVVDILTTKESSIPAARAVNGGTKKRKSKHIAAQTTIPGTGLPPEIIDNAASAGAAAAIAG